MPNRFAADNMGRKGPSAGPDRRPLNSRMPRFAPKLDVIAAVCLLWCCGGVATAFAAPSATVVSSTDTPQRLVRGWQAIRAPDDSAQPSADDPRWTEVSVENVLGAQGSVDFAGLTWLRLRLQLPAAASSSALGVSVGPVDYGGGVVVVNGRECGSFGPRTTNEKSVVASTVTFPIPTEGIDATGALEIAVRVWRDPAYAGVPVELDRRAVADVQIGHIDDLRVRADLSYKSGLLESVDILVLGVVFILAGLYHIQLFSRRREQTEYLWFGTIAVAAALNMIFSSPWGKQTLDPLIAFFISRTALHVAGAAWLGFLWKIFGWRFGPLARAYVALQGVLILLNITVPVFVLVTLGDRPVLILIVTFFLWFGVIPVQALRGNREARTICVGLIFLATARLWQLLGGLGFVPMQNFVHWGFFALLLSIAVSLSNRFSRVYRDLDALNQDLEGKVAQRTQELAETVTQLRESERLANEAREAAQVASESKSLFLASMSHELRTPLNAILGFVQLLRRRHSLNEETRHGLSVIMRSGEHLLSLINDILSITKIEAGQMTLKEEPFDLHHLLDDLYETFQPRAEAKGLVLTVRCDASVPRQVCGDDGKLRQILINLLGNALRYTQSGTIDLEASLVGDRTNFRVRDTGFGIAPEEQGRLFTAFSQTTSGMHAKEGTGLGLAISRANARLMGGDISVESELSVGTTFTVSLPFRVMTKPMAGNRSRRVVGLESGHPAVRVLVVDDVTENRHLLSALMTDAGFTACEASTGRDAIAKWETWKPDLIWMDIRMAGIDGIEATRMIRERERDSDRRCRIIALTASAFDTDRAMILDAGCDDFVSKPFRDRVIFEKMAEHLGVRYAYAEETDDNVDDALIDAGSVPLDVEALATLPPEWVAMLDQAVQQGDAEAAIDVADRIAELDAVLAEDLRRLVRAYGFDEISEALSSARRQTEV